MDANARKPSAQPTIPYGRHCIGEDDIAAVVEVLRSDWLTTGPKVAEFENDFADQVGCDHAVAVNSGTAALHCSMFALDIAQGDEVIVPTITFAASANCIVYQGGTPVFADVDSRTLLIDVADVERKLTPRTRAIIAVDFAGQPCDYKALRELAGSRDIALVADGCHALGARQDGQAVGTLADATAFSLHPVKHITAGEGGVITTNEKLLAERMRRFRNHGITRDLHQRQHDQSWFYEIPSLGFNYRISDIQSALAQSQLKKLPQWIARRQQIAAYYDHQLRSIGAFQPLLKLDNVEHAYHLYVVRCGGGEAARGFAFQRLRELGIGVNVHYIPVHQHPYYQQTADANCPVAESVYGEILSIPVFPAMTDAEMSRVVNALRQVDNELENRRQAA